MISDPRLVEDYKVQAEQLSILIAAANQTEVDFYKAGYVTPLRLVVMDERFRPSPLQAIIRKMKVET